jgi:ATP-dependent Lon protease
MDCRDKKTSSSASVDSQPTHSYFTRSKGKNDNKKNADKGRIKKCISDDDTSEDDDDEWATDDEHDDTIDDIIVKLVNSSNKKLKNNKEEENKNGDMFDHIGQLDTTKYTQFLSQLFPSKYIKEKLKNNIVSNKVESNKVESNKVETDEAETDEAETDEAETDEVESDDIDSDNEQYANKKKNKKVNNVLKNFNIIFTVGGMKNKGHKNEYSYEDDEEETEDDTEDEDEDTEDDTEVENTKDEDTEDDTEDEYTPITESRTESGKETKTSTNAIITDETAFSKLKELIAGFSEEERNNKTIKKYITDIKNDEKKYIKNQERNMKKEKGKNAKNFKNLLREKNVMNDVQYFHDKLTTIQQTSVIRQLKEIQLHSEVDKPYRLSLIESEIPITYKACALKKITTLQYMDPGASEFYKIKNWVDTFMQIPFGKNKMLPLTIADGIEKCHEFMDTSKKILDSAVYGLNDAKLQIMQMVGQWLVNPTALGTAIAIKGPMGTGKTTLVKEGISKILGRDFAFIALGGATDSSFLEGHSYTYEGSSWGKIVDILIQSKSMNPVIYFDELDKVSDTPKGEEIIGILTHLTDTTQNSKFHDKYFAGIDFDISRCLFIFSYNDESKVNPILRDRMYRIHTKGYDLSQKTVISIQHLLPRIREQVCFNEEDIVIPDETIHYIINTHTEKEDGVRNLKRCLEIIYTKLNLYRLMKPGVNLFENDDMLLKVEFPMTITPVLVDKLIKKNNESGSWTGMYS